ncbi:MAG TPA: cysteine peptidase family C39 domain-containing protein [Gemmataceae bacterium]|jgi:ABC-type bacteriocin/lantibiotic exporter with double-glycine peptidase domain
MNSKPPFVGQERPDACAIACLRMVLSYQGTQVSEAELVQQTDLQEGGLTPAEISRLARLYGLRAVEEQLDLARLTELVNEQRFPIVFLFRRPIDRVDETHAVIPLRFTRQYVILLDPLRGERRVTIRKFEEARRLVGRWVVVWEPS